MFAAGLSVRQQADDGGVDQQSRHRQVEEQGVFAQDVTKDVPAQRPAGVCQKRTCGSRFSRITFNKPHQKENRKPLVVPRINLNVRL